MLHATVDQPAAERKSGQITICDGLWPLRSQELMPTSIPAPAKVDWGQLVRDRLTRVQLDGRTAKQDIMRMCPFSYKVATARKCPGLSCYILLTMPV